MSKAQFLIYLYMLIGISKLYTQVQVNGFIADAETGEPLIGASVYIEETLKGTTSNNFGFYTITVDQYEPINIQFSFVGYKTARLTLSLSNDTLLKVYLPAGAVLEEFEVKGKLDKNLEQVATMSKLDIPMDQILMIPSITGEPDILKAYQLMPGVQGGQEGNNGLFVRGGTPDQNLFLLDDVPLFNVSHIGGLYSVFDPSMVKSIDFYKGGFPARYGGKTSGVIDVRNKDGNLKEWKGELGLSLILSKFFIEGPLLKDKSSFAFSIRRSNLDFYSYLYGAISDRTYIVGYGFYDINSKANISIGERDRLILNLYHGRDKNFYREPDNNSDNIKTESEFDQRWGNSTGSVRWQHIINNSIFQNITLATTKYIFKNEISSKTQNDLDNSYSSEDYSILSGVNNIILNADFEIPFSQSSIKTGVHFTHNNYTPTQIYFSQFQEIPDDETKDETSNYSSKLFANQWSYYLEYLFLYKRFSGNVGFRLNNYVVTGKAYPSFQPRLVLNYQVTESLSLKGGASLMEQNTHLLTNSNTGLPTDIWIPSNDKIAPEKSEQLSVGLAYVDEKKIEFSLEGYYKKLNNLISYKEGVIIFSTGENWDDKVETGGLGWVKGLEFLVQKKQGRLTGWIGYTLSQNNRMFQNLNMGKKYPFKYDQRHDFSAVASYRFNKKWSLSSTWVYHTGHKVTIPSGKYQLYNYQYLYTNDDRNEYADVHIYNDKNGYKMPDYHRLDIGWTYVKVKSKGTATWTWGIYNVYNRQNAYYLFFKGMNGETKFYQQSIFPIFLNFGYTYVF